LGLTLLPAMAVRNLVTRTEVDGGKKKSRVEIKSESFLRKTHIQSGKKETGEKTVNFAMVKRRNEGHTLTLLGGNDQKTGMGFTTGRSNFAKAEKKNCEIGNKKRCHAKWATR